MKFKQYQMVRHVKTDINYFISMTPKKLRLEKNNIPAYAYREAGKPNSTTRVLCQEEMEDGRFESVSI